MRGTRERCGFVQAASLGLLTLVSGCTLVGTSSPPRPTCTSLDGSGAASAATATFEGGDLVILGRIITMDEPAVAEALLIEEGLVTCVGSRDDVLAAGGDEARVIDIGANVAYPGFIDAHAHWVGDRDYYNIGSAEEAMAQAIRHGWTTISEQWVNDERLAELEALAADGPLPLRVDAYLALNYDQEFFGDWYVEREPGWVGDHLRVRGVKIHVDTGDGQFVNWDPRELTSTIGRANEAGWQVSAHAVSTEAMEIVLGAFEAAIGPNGPNPLHHRIEHALQVTDAQLERMVAMDLVPVIQLDGVAGDWVQWAASLGDEGRDYESEGVELLGRWREFLDAGLHVAATTDMPWFLVDFELTDDIGRPHDQIAGGMDGRSRSYADTPAWVLDQLLTAEEGLRALTVNAAWALGDETSRGHLARGTLGDVTILSGNVLDATPDEIRAMEVIATIVGGEIAYCADPDACG